MADLNSTYNLADNTWTTWTTCDGTPYVTTAWTTWNGTTVATDTATITYGRIWNEPTKQELAASKKMTEAIRKKEEAAKKRATETLRRHLSPSQRKQYDTGNHFHVVGSDGKRYEIDCKKRMHNVFEIDERGKRLVEYCIFQSGSTPLPDNHLAQKLLLEADAERFRKIANQIRLAS